MGIKKDTTGTTDTRDIIKLGKIAKNIGGTIASGGGEAVVDLTVKGAKNGGSGNNSGGTSGVSDANAAVNAADMKKSDTDSGTTAAVRDYTAGKGYSGAVDWDGENVIVGGTAITPTEVKNGVAYADTDAIDDAISAMERRAGIAGADELKSDYNTTIGNSLSSATAALSDYAAFGYDPDTDPAYAAYKREYTEAAEEALRRILNDNNTSVSGASGSVLSEAMAAYYKNMRAITDMIPTLEQNAYNRWKGGAEILSGNADTLGEIADEYYDNIYGTERERIDTLNSANVAERAEQQRWITNAANERETALKEAAEEREAQNDYYDNALDAQSLRRGEIELEYLPESESESLRSQKLKNDQVAFENTVTQAKERGNFIRDDEEALPWLSAYRVGYNSYSITPWEVETRYTYDIEHAKKSADYYASMGM